MKYWIQKISSKKDISMTKRILCQHQPLAMTMKEPRKNKFFISSLRELDVPHIIYDNIIQKQLYKHGLYLNRIDFGFLRISLKTK